MPGGGIHFLPVPVEHDDLRLAVIIHHLAGIRHDGHGRLCRTDIMDQDAFQRAAAVAFARIKGQPGGDVVEIAGTRQKDRVTVADFILQGDKIAVGGGRQPQSQGEAHDEQRCRSAPGAGMACRIGLRPAARMTTSSLSTASLL